MKQIYIKFSMLLLCLVVGLNAWGQTTVTFTFKTDKDITYTSTGKSGGGQACKVSKSNVTLEGTNAYTESANTLIVYKSSKLTITAPGNITSVALEYNGQCYPFNEAVGDGSVDTKYGNESSTHAASFTPATTTTSITFNSSSKGKVELNSLAVTYTPSSSDSNTTYTVTFSNDANKGTCTTTTLTEASAGAGVTLPSCTPNDGYTFGGWTATEDGTTVDDGLEVGETYYPEANVTLYAVYSAAVQTGGSFKLVFKETGTDKDSSSKYDVNDLTKVFTKGGEYVSSITGFSNVCPAGTARGAKFGSSGKSGTLTINLKNAVKLGKIVVECSGYASNESNGFIINGDDFTSTTYAKNGFEELTYTVPGVISSISIATPSSRGYVKSITIYPEEPIYMFTNTEDMFTEAGVLAFLSAEGEGESATYKVNALTTTIVDGKVKTVDVYDKFKVEDIIYMPGLNGAAECTIEKELKEMYFGGESIKENVFTIKCGTQYLACNGGNFVLADEPAYYAYNFNVGSIDLLLLDLDAEANVVDFYNVISDEDNNLCLAPYSGESNMLTFNFYKMYQIPTLTIPIAAACTDGERCYSTYSFDYSWVVPSNLVVSEIGVNDGKLVVADYQSGAVVPANTGVMVSAKNGGNFSAKYATAYGESVLGENNCLRPTGIEGITADEMVAKDQNCTYYRLTMHNGTQIGYWWGAAEGAAFSVAANKAYLAVPASSSVKAQMWFGDNATSISAPAIENNANDAIYNLNGQRVNTVTKGMYIKNGKKYFVK